MISQVLCSDELFVKYLKLLGKLNSWEFIKKCLTDCLAGKEDHSNGII